MSDIFVNSSAALVAAVKKAKPGDVIKLASGTYSDISLRGIQANGVTITSADPAHKAVLADLQIRDSSGITVSNLDLSTNAGNAKQVFLTYQSSDIHFDHIEVHGPAGQGSSSTVSPFSIRGSTNVSVTNSEFHDLWHGLGLASNDGVVVSGNYFHDIRTDGVRGGGNSDMMISNNMFTTFTPAQGDHPDAIQLWTTNTTASAHDITIADNLVVRGEGEPIQGIFIRDETDHLPYLNVTVANNMVLGGNYNGIALDGVVGGVVTGNTVLGASDQRSWIRVTASRGVQVAANSATYYAVDGATRDGVLAGNAMALDLVGSGATQIHDWLAAGTKLTGVWGDDSTVLKTLGLTYVTKIGALAHEPDYVTITGTSGDDKLKVKAGFDTHLIGGDGNDTLTGAGDGTHNVLIGGAGDDNYSIKGAGDLVVEDANGGYDTVNTMVDYTLTANVEVLRLGTDGLTGIGNELDNRIVGTSGIDHMFGMGGNDLIQGLDGDDYISGGDGDDDLRADGGNDVVHGDAGNDKIDGGDGDDTLFGDDGNDTITGGAGNDIIHGGNGDDVIDGGAGTDIMTGGAGADVFKFRLADIANDVITDFTRGEDRIDLKLIDAKIATARDDAFTFIGTSDFHHTAGELHYTLVHGDAVVSGDVDGDGVADFSFTLHGVSQLSASDFVL